MQQAPLISNYYRTRENTLITCQFGDFEAALTSKRLIINYKQLSESIKLQHIRAVTIVDDHETLQLRKALFIRKRKRIYRLALALTGALSAYFLFPAFVLAGTVTGTSLGILLSSFLPINTKSISTPSLLLVVLENQIKEYPFNQPVNADVATLARFMLQIETALYD